MLITVVGNYPKIPNLPRPARLRNAYARLDRGDIASEEMARVEDEVTKEVIKEQEDAGVELVTDGQIRWLDEFTYLAGRLDGVQINGLIRFFDTNMYYRQPVVQGSIAWREPITVRDFDFARANASRPVKPVLTGPYTLARLSQDDSSASLDRLAQAFAAALNQEALTLQARSPALIQFNEPAITLHPEDAALAQAAWRTLLAGLTLETAVYFYFGPPGAAYASAVAAGFTTVGVDVTIPGVLESLRGKPKPQKLAVGAIDARTTRLESAEQIAAVVHEAQALAGAEDLYINPNMGLEFLPREQAYAKLLRLVEGANRVRGAAA